MDPGLDLETALRPEPEMLGADAGHLGLLVDVGCGLFSMFLAQDWCQIALAVLAAIDQGKYVVDVPAVAGGNFLATPVAAATVSVEDAQFDARRHGRFRRLADPLRHRPHWRPPCHFPGLVVVRAAFRVAARCRGRPPCPDQKRFAMRSAAAPPS